MATDPKHNLRKRHFGHNLAGMVRYRQRNGYGPRQRATGLAHPTPWEHGKRAPAGRYASPRRTAAGSWECSMTPDQEGREFAESLEYPPGVAGDIAAFIYQASPRPVTPVAITAALAWLAGVAGWSFTYSGTGLNLYLTLVAPSGRGKEMLHDGPGLLNRALFAGLGDIPSAGLPLIPNASDFFCYDTFASGAALAKACANQTNKSFVNFVGEWGHVLSALARATGAGGSMHMQTLRRMLTNLFHKSGAGSMAGGVRYANEKENAVSVDGVAYTLVGETTAETLYEAITVSMLADGFLSRFLTIEYNGPRPPLNSARVLVPSPQITTHLRGLLVHSLTLKGRGVRAPVAHGDYAERELNSFNDECDEAINASTNEAVTQTWNRAHLKALRVAALLAVADNPLDPVISGDHAEWAVALVRRDTDRYLARLAAGDVGSDDDTRLQKLLHIVHEYLTQPLGPGYGVPSVMQRDAVVPRKYLQMRASRLAVFKDPRLSAKRALDDAIAGAMDNGYLAEMPKDKAGEQYTFMGRCFHVVSLPKFK